MVTMGAETRGLVGRRARGLEDERGRSEGMQDTAAASNLEPRIVE